MKTHLMIDLETMSFRMNAVVLELGYCLFNPFGEGIEFSATLRPDVEEQILAGRHMSYSTVKWWMRQDELARKKVTSDEFQVLGVQYFLDNIQCGIPWSTIDGIWCHGANFDAPILDDLFQQYKMKAPWKYNQVRDTRTVYWLWPTDMIQATVKHSAEDDAIAQALTVQKCLKQMYNPNKD